jgi:hypothetical protein
MKSKKSKKLVLSSFFADLYDLYVEEIQRMMLKQGQENLKHFQTELQIRRTESATYLSLMDTNPEFAVPIFYGIFNFGKGAHDIMPALLKTEGPSFPKPGTFLKHITLESSGKALLSKVPKAGYDNFVSIAIGLEYMRMNEGNLFATAEDTPNMPNHGPDSDGGDDDGEPGDLDLNGQLDQADQTQ